MNFDTGGKLTAVISAGDENQMKPLYLRKICKTLSIEITKCAVVGDGGNNLEIFRVTEHGITFIDSSDTMKQAAEHTITALSDLRNIF